VDHWEGKILSKILPSREYSEEEVGWAEDKHGGVLKPLEGRW